MAKERLKPISLHQEMQRSYLEYAMSVIVGRALPDVRDGLKPVQRRILFAMHELGLTPDRPYRKCARVVGDVLGKYHPHGDQAVYDALVRLVQDFSSRYPVLDGHGNFGSVDDDPPAAMRYTETRLASIAHESLLNEIGDETVDFASNFDGSQQEPSVLPAQLPFLLINGCSGIAVGMATSIPPHNLNEVVNALVAIVKEPNINDEKLLKIIPGPDFPTGGEVLLSSGLKDTYIKGRGSIPMRGLTHIEEINPGKGKHKRNAVIITELPYQLSKAGWIEKVAEQVNEGKIIGIADIRDESDREGMRVVIELRRDAVADKVLKDLERKSSLQSNFGAILLALVNGQPKQLSLKELLQNFLNFRENTIIRRIKFALKKTKNRLEVVEGLIKAIGNLRAIIDLIEKAKEISEAKAKITNFLNVSDKQAEAILAMPLKKLTGLEQQSLRDEMNELKKSKTEYEKLLMDRAKLLELLVKELLTLKKRFGNERKTKLIEGGDQLIAEKNAIQRPTAELQRQQAFNALSLDSKIIIQANNQVKILSPQVLGKLHLEEESDLSEDVSPGQILTAVNEKPNLLAVTETGKVALIRWEFAGKQPGSIDRFLPTGLEKEKILKVIKLPKVNNFSLCLLSSDGKFKRLAGNEVLELSGRSSTILKLKDGISLKSAFLSKESDEIIIASDIGRVIKVKSDDIDTPVLGKLAQGYSTMRLLPGENIIGGVSCSKDEDNIPLFVSSIGKLNLINSDCIRRSNRGCMGEIIIKLDKKESLVDICICHNINSLVTNTGRTKRIHKQSLISSNGKQEKFLVKLKEDEYIQKIIPLKT
tara:strand:+ start:2102 stop:4558 length:2457 start_codon:yes stop_codon:yes gene_type:complete